MSPLQAAAEFAAYTDFMHRSENAGATQADAHAFADLHWPQFIGQADIGFGRLLLAMKQDREAMSATDLVLDGEAEVVATYDDAEFELAGV